MPPKKQPQDDPPAIKEKLAGPRNPRNGRAQAAYAALKDVDHASVHSGQMSSDSNSSNIKWSSQDPSVLQNYRRAYHLDTPAPFKNPLSHVVLAQGIGRFSPTMARPKPKRRIQKDHVAMAVRRHFNALGVIESDVIVDWLYKTKHQDKEFRVRFAPPRK